VQNPNITDPEKKATIIKYFKSEEDMYSTWRILISLSPPYVWTTKKETADDTEHGYLVPYIVMIDSTLRGAAIYKSDSSGKINGNVNNPILANLAINRAEYEMENLVPCSARIYLKKLGYELEIPIHVKVPTRMNQPYANPPYVSATYPNQIFTTAGTVNAFNTPIYAPPQSYTQMGTTTTWGDLEGLWNNTIYFQDQNYQAQMQATQQYATAPGTVVFTEDLPSSSPPETKSEDGGGLKKLFGGILGNLISKA
jgi:hypothetical protein